MTQRCWKAFARTFAVFVALATAAGSGALSAQSSGKLEGRVRDGQNAPIANARVTIVGTAFTTTSAPNGYYFFNSVPSGVVSLRVAFVGYKPREYEGLRILSGQTIAQDVLLEQTAVVVTDITVTVAQNALVPRDAVTTKQIISGDFADKLPVDRISSVMALQPGVVAQNCTNAQLQSGCNPNIYVRGSRADESSTYVDGVPIQAGNRGTSTGGSGALSVGVNAFEDASITTGASSAEFGNAQGGIINITTRSGGSRLSGNVSAETNSIGAARYKGGYNMFQGSIGGPLPIAKNLTWYLSGRIEGSTANNQGYKAWEVPNFNRTKVDTFFTVPRNALQVSGSASNQAGSYRSDSVVVNVYDYAVTKGDCNSFSFIKDAGSAAPVGAQADIAAMRDNYGATCTQNTTYQSPQTDYNASMRLNYSFLRGSRLSFSYLWSGRQTRNQISDGRATGQTNSNNVAVLNWTQVLSRQSSRQLSLDAYLSYQWNTQLGGNLTTESESSTRDASLGMLTKKLQYNITPDQFPICPDGCNSAEDSLLLYNMLFNRLGKRTPTLTDRVNTSQYSALTNYSITIPDPIGTRTAAGGGGNDLTYTYNQENRWYGRANIDWQVDRYNRLKLGGEGTLYDITNFGGQTNTWVYKPVKYSAYAEDRLDLGDVVLVGGIRWDYFWAKTWRWKDYPRISTAPGFNQDSLYCLNEQDITASICRLSHDPSYTYVSPHIQVAFPVTEKTNFRLSYAQQAEAPDFGLVYRQSTADIDASNTNQRANWGGNLGFGKTITFEFGARHAFSDDMVLDVTLYNKDNVANPGTKFAFPIDPVTTAPTRLYIAQNTDFGNTRGLDVRLDRRVGNYLNGSIGYSYQDVRNTGSDPFSFISAFEGATTPQPPLALIPVSYSRPHTLTGQFNLALPSDWKQGTLLGALLHRTGIFTTWRFTSGTPYTKCDPLDESTIGTLTSATGTGNTCGNSGSASAYNGARLPMFKTFDLKLTREFRIGKMDMTAYLDGRNFLNLQNVTRVWAQTGTTANGAQGKRLWINDSVTYKQFGDQTGLRQPNGDIVLPPNQASCVKVANGATSFAPQCFYYMRSEQQFGNGDGRYTLVEQRAASDLANYYNTFHISNFVTGARVIRLGLEVNF